MKCPNLLNQEMVRLNDFTSKETPASYKQPIACFPSRHQRVKDGAVYFKKFMRQMLSMYILKCARIVISTYNNSDVTAVQNHYK